MKKCAFDHHVELGCEPSGVGAFCERNGDIDRNEIITLSTALAGVKMPPLVSMHVNRHVLPRRGISTTLLWRDCRYQDSVTACKYRLQCL